MDRRAKGAEGEHCGRFEREGLAGLLDDDIASSGPAGEPAGEIDDRAARAELAAHLETCADCRADRARYQRLARAMADLGRSTPAPDPVDRVLAIVADDARAPRRPVLQMRRALEVVGPLLAVAAAVAMMWWLMQ